MSDIGDDFIEIYDREEKDEEGVCPTCRNGPVKVKSTSSNVPPTLY